MFDTFKQITNVSLIPLKGMELERNYSPFENESNCTIIRLQIILEMLPYLDFWVQKMDFFFTTLVFPTHMLRQFLIKTVNFWH